MRYKNFAVFCGHILRIDKERKLPRTHYAFSPLELAQGGFNAPIAAFLSASCVYAAFPARNITLTRGGGCSDLVNTDQAMSDGHFHALYAVGFGLSQHISL